MFTEFTKMNPVAISLLFYRRMNSLCDRCVLCERHILVQALFLRLMYSV
jgi:hypothetical protein